jgi:trehalose 6-phosphate phosphatase
MSDPGTIAAEVQALEGIPLLGLDVDGVLAPIVGHAADAALLPGVLDSLITLASRVPVGVVSGRSVGDLARFGFPASIMVAGSHGAERRGMPMEPLTSVERARLDRLVTLAEAAAVDAGAGAWVEHKPTGAVLHVREADPARAKPAVDRLDALARLVAGAQVRPGHEVLELAARPASKARAVRTMWEESGASSVVYVGDDVTDEEVFRGLRPIDIGIRVGTGPTLATRRLADPPAVARLLAILAR